MIGRLFAQLGLLTRALPYLVPGLGPARARRRFPRTDGAIRVRGLGATVEVLRDEWGVPHVFAGDERDAVFAQGYAVAQDRLWQLVVGRHLGDGTLASLLGPPGVPADRLFRTLGLRRIAERWWGETTGEARALLEAYAAGVNARLENEPLPVECELLDARPAPWSPIDSLTRGALLAYMLGGNHRLELLRARLVAEAGEAVAALLLPQSAPDSPAIVPREALVLRGLRGARALEGLDGVDRLLGDPNIVSGSNNWVVHGSRTASGKPLLANDVHIALAMPGTWYECGVHGGRFDAVGFALPGVPLIVLGHNGRVAWGMSNLGPDTQDFYIEKVDDPAAPRRYEWRGEWHDLDIRRESIPVRGGAEVPIEIRRTRHGPIMNEAMSVVLAGAEPMALRWAIEECGSLVEPLLGMNAAGNCDEFRAALARWESPGQNFVFADIEGHIGYQATGRIPLRAKDHLGNTPVPGWTGEHEWRGWIPFEELPASADPPAGYVATANNKITDDDYPHLIAWNWFPGYRAKRIVELLEAGERHTVEDMRRIQAETYSLPAEALRPYLACVAPKDEMERRAHALVMAWDLRFEIDRAGATIYQAFYISLLRRLLARKLGAGLVERYLAGEYERHGSMHVPLVIALAADVNHEWWADPGAPEIPAAERRDSTIRAAFSEAVGWLAKRYGANPADWTWGRAHTLTLAHSPFGAVPLLKRLFNSRTYPARGDNYTVDGASFLWNQPFDVVHGTAQRMVIDLGDPNRSVGIQIPGQSAHLHHPHREDLLAMSHRGEDHPLLHSRAAVEARAKARLRLEPDGR